MHVLVVTYKMFRRALLQNRLSERYQQHPPFTAISLMQPSTVPSLGPSVSTSVSVEAVAPTVTALSSSAEACIVGKETTPIPARLV